MKVCFLLFYHKNSKHFIFPRFNLKRWKIEQNREKWSTKKSKKKGIFILIIVWIIRTCGGGGWSSGHEIFTTFSSCDFGDFLNTTSNFWKKPPKIVHTYPLCFPLGEDETFPKSNFIEKRDPGWGTSITHFPLSAKNIEIQNLSLITHFLTTQLEFLLGPFETFSHKNLEGTTFIRF